MKKTFLSTLAVALLLGLAQLSALVGTTFAKDEAPAAQATGMKALAVVSLAGYDKILADVSYIGKLGNNAGLERENLEGMLKLFTNGQGVNGLDTTGPWGLAVSTDGVQPQALIFLPVKNMKTLLTSLAAITGEPKDSGDGVVEIRPNGQRIYLKEVGGWAFIAQNPESLTAAALPKDPLRLLGNLPAKYDVAIRLNVQNIPDFYRSMAIDQFKDQIEKNLERQPDEDDAAYDLRKRMIKNQTQSIISFINDTDEITIGWTLNPKTKSTYLDVQVTALPGTKMAKQFTQVKPTNSDFAGFVLPDAAATINFATTTAPEDIEQAVTTLDALRANALKQIDKEDDLPDDASKKIAKEAVTEFLEVLKATLKSGKMDAGAALVLAPSSLSVVAGGYVAEPVRLEAALKKVVELAKNEPDFPAIKWDAETYKGVRFHTLLVPVTDDKAAKVLGDKLDVAVGIGAKNVYVAAGKSSLETLKKAIDASATSTSKTVPPLQIVASLAPILKFAASSDTNNPMLGMLVAELEKVPGQDHITLLAAPVKNGVAYRLEAQEGVLKLIGQASKGATPGGGIR